MSRNNIEAVIKEIPLLSGLSFDDINIKKLSGLTNRNYHLITSGQHYVLRIPKKSTDVFINRANESHNADIAQALSIAPKNLWRGGGKLVGASLTEFIANASYLKSSDQQGIDNLAQTLVILQESKKTFKGLLDNQKIVQHLKQYFRLCSDKQQKILKAEYNKTLLLLGSQRSNRPVVPAHVDLVAENILQKHKSTYLIDWEYSAMASPFWDIATVCNSNNLDENESEYFLKMVLKNCQTKDLQSLKDYQFITKTVSNCWKAAFS